MNKKYALGIIGSGNMASAIINGIIRNNRLLEPNQIIVSDVDQSKLDYIAESGLHTTTDNRDVILNSDYILFAVKPQIFLSLNDLSLINNDQHIISIMAGISIDTMLKAVGRDVPVCRVMPNTPCMIGHGMSVLCYYNYEDESKDFVNRIFSSIGEIAEMEESAFDAVTSISGSGPAYVYTFINAMVKGGVEGSLSLEDSRKLAVQTVIGAANMVKLNNSQPIEELISAVCSKGGTTIEAVNSFKNDNLEDIIIKGITACRKRSKELSGK